jgi:methionyl aminopeptidase
MDEEIKNKYYRSGEIAALARDKGATKVKPGTTLLSVAKYIESIILSNGAEPAFPVNISLNNIAAHYTPRCEDTKMFQSGDLVKIDVGAHIDGYIADTAITIEVKTDNYCPLCEASDNALNQVLRKIKPGISLSTIGQIVKKTITSYGFKPIENLTGHSMNRFHLHSGLSIPNVPSTNILKKPRVNDVIAIEPFATDGYGRVVSGKGSNIYQIKKSPHLRTLRDKRSKAQIKKIKNEFHTLPFAYRWCEKFISNTEITLKRLIHQGLLHHFPQLIEQNNGIVSQKEHTVIITNNSCEITTLGKNEEVFG